MSTKGLCTFIVKSVRYVAVGEIKQAFILHSCWLFSFLHDDTLCDEILHVCVREPAPTGQVLSQ